MVVSLGEHAPHSPPKHKSCEDQVPGCALADCPEHCEIGVDKSKSFVFSFWIRASGSEAVVTKGTALSLGL